MLDTLVSECKNRSLNVSVTNQKINDFSVEIYTGYKTTYKCLFYTDGHLYSEVAITEALEFLKTI